MHGGGAERVAALLCNHWVERGYEVTLMPTFSGRGVCLHQLDERVQVDYLADRVNCTRKTLWNTLRRFFALRRTIREVVPDVVVSFLTHVNVAALLATRGLPVQVVISERTYPPAMLLGAKWALLRQVTYWQAATVVAQTADTARWLERCCPRSRICVIANPVVFPLPENDPWLSPELWLGKDQRVIIAVGRLGPEKGFDQLLKAFARFAGEWPQWDLVILGEGEQRQQLESLRDELDLIGRAHFPGWAGNVADWYRRADLYVMSSRFEGFPNTLLEAMAHGLPAVTFDCRTGPRDIVRPGIDGLLVAPDRGVAGLAAALTKLIEDSDLRTRMGEAACSVRESFSISRIGDLWAEVIEVNQ